MSLRSHVEPHALALADLATLDVSERDGAVLAVTGRATAHHLARGGCIEELREDGRVSRTWVNAWPWPAWRRRAVRVDYAPWT